jgi:23S rRNA pseudouridine1911/1915/1917 synthase
MKIRLDKFLTQKFPNYSRAFLKSQIKQGNVLVNGQIKKPSYILKENDKVETSVKEPEKSVLRPNPDINLKIIYEDENIIAIDKPAGISVHPTAGKKQNNTIANALLAYYPAIANVGDPSTSSGQADLRPGIVHRLDKDTSGIMVVAKNQKTFDWLKKQFAERKVEKKYIALAYGRIKNKKGVISKSIGKTKDFRKRTIAPVKEQKEAITYYKILRHYNSFTLVDLQPKTGRTHQIRVHLASIGHPIAGDKLYSFKNQKMPPDLKRQFLHASHLKFSLPNGKIVELKSELPEDLQKIINTLSQARK